MAINQRTVFFRQKRVQRLAQNVTAGTIDKHWRDARDLTYLSIAVDTGAAAPDEAAFFSRGRRMFENGDQERIETTEAVDVYCYCNKESETTTERGRLIVTTEA